MSYYPLWLVGLEPCTNNELKEQLYINVWKDVKDGMGKRLNP
jgi:hypothetical protein